ncbi:MAG: hypothetical protein K9H16_03225, partial [Bacteroidales bacterium]|nr:hypothetical protein [Bacteroidales bacterium]
MKKIYMFIYLFILAMISITSGLSAQTLTGDLKFWQKADFLGFDEIGDCNAETGDISSVFARVEQSRMLLRVTFDNMVSREHNEITSDNFAGVNISLKIKLTRQNTRTTFFDEELDLSAGKISLRSLRALRTPSSNLWETEITLPQPLQRENIEFSLTVLLDGKVVDYFHADGGPTDAEGNCAFVHHGNQGITYTEVFYGSPGGQSGL